MNNEEISFIQQNSPDGALKHSLQGKDFLQSPEWRKFQESVGRKTHSVSGDDFCASIIEHNLPLVGKYFYIPRGPIIRDQGSKNKEQYVQLINLAKKNNAGWIRIDPGDSRVLDIISENWRVVKAPHDMQPRELFIIDITKPEEQILAEMKAKTRYNIGIAKKRGVKVLCIKYDVLNIKYVDEFIRLTSVMAKRQGIAAHPESYYRKMLEVIPGDILKLYVAEYENKIIAANLVVFYGKTCVYLHGASDDQYRNVMAPFLLQWRQIQDAKEAGCERYDFGGVKAIINEQGTTISKKGNWEGITKFKVGFSPETRPTEFPGSYDIIINQKKYWLYKILSVAMPLIKYLKR